MKKAIGIITREPNEEILNFYNKFTNYDIFIIIDNNKKLFTNLRKKYSNVNFIKLNNKYCYDKGYTNSSSIYMNFNKVISWDKALLVFNELKIKYGYVWLIEDDVWFYGEEVLLKIDAKYLDSDLLTNKFNVEEKLVGWPWDVLEINLEPPYYKGMVNCCRLSSNVFKIINDYVVKNKTLFFIEVAIPTLCIKNNLKCDFPLEMRTLSYDSIFEFEKLDKIKLFHPFKNYKEQELIRQKMDS